MNRNRWDDMGKYFEDNSELNEPHAMEGYYEEPPFDYELGIGAATEAPERVIGPGRFNTIKNYLGRLAAKLL